MICNDNEKSTASAKNEFDHETKTGQTQAEPIIEGPIGARQQTAPSPYSTFDNGVRGPSDESHRSGPSDAEASPRTDGNDLSVFRHWDNERKSPGDRLESEPSAGEAQRDRINSADDTAHADEEIVIVVEEKKTVGDIVSAALAEIGQTRLPLDLEKHQYLSKISLLQDQFNRTWGSLQKRWSETLSLYAPKSNSFFLMRAAALWGKRRELSLMLKENAKITESGDCLGTPLEACVDARMVEFITKANGYLSEAEAIKAVDRRHILEITGQTSKKVESKKHDLKKLPPDWKKQIVQRAKRSPTYGAAIRIMELTGCRPVELVHGLRVRFDEGEAVIRVTQGAKLSEISGQEWREVKVAIHELPLIINEPLLEGANEVVVKIISAAGMGSVLREYGRELGFDVSISPYLFRHLLAQELRENGWAGHQIGAVLGHASAETSALYGIKRRPGKRKPPQIHFSPADVKVPRPIKPRAVFEGMSVSRKKKRP